jgi:hypothetical protein
MSNTVIRIKSSGVTGNLPATLQPGELAINYFDGQLFYGNSTSQSVPYATVTEPAGLNGEMQFNDSGSFGSDATLSFNSNTKLLIATAIQAGSLNVEPAIQSAYLHANSAYGQANTADQRAVTSGSYANSAFARANTADVKAQAAFDQANTGGGGPAFARIVISGQPDAIANIASAPLTLVAGSNINLSTDGVSNTITISSTGGGGGAAPSGYLANTVIVANSAGFLSNSNIFFTSANVLSLAGTVNANSFNVGGSAFINTDRTITYYGTTHNQLGSGSGTIDINLTLGNFISATVAGATTWTFSNPIASPAVTGFILELTNGGSAAMTWPASVKWPGGTAPALTSSGIDVLTFFTDDGGTTYRGVLSMLDSK